MTVSPIFISPEFKEEEKATEGIGYVTAEKAGDIRNKIRDLRPNVTDKLF